MGLSLDTLKFMFKTSFPISYLAISTRTVITTTAAAIEQIMHRESPAT
jgi:hypothetical protein